MENMGIMQFLQTFFANEGDTHLAADYAAFCDLNDERQYVDDITSKVFANVKLKKEMAKTIVSHILAGDYHCLVPYYLHSMDARLRLLVKYYLSVAVLNDNSLPEDKVNRAVNFCADKPNNVDVRRGSYLHGWIIVDISLDAIVRMQSGDDFYGGYRFFVVNMLCFTASRFVLGMRTDGGPVRSSMKYYKGCRPLGIEKDSEGIAWNLIECDMSLSDDSLAIFSNAFDGDGTIEICDWFNPHQHLIIFRTNF